MGPVFAPPASPRQSCRSPSGRPRSWRRRRAARTGSGCRRSCGRGSSPRRRSPQPRVLVQLEGDVDGPVARLAREREVQERVARGRVLDGVVEVEDVAVGGVEPLFSVVRPGRPDRAPWSRRRRRCPGCGSDVWPTSPLASRPCQSISPSTLSWLPSPPWNWLPGSAWSVGVKFVCAGRGAGQHEHAEHHQHGAREPRKPPPGHRSPTSSQSRTLRPCPALPLDSLHARRRRHHPGVAKDSLDTFVPAPAGSRAMSAGEVFGLTRVESRAARARSSVGERSLHTREVAGSSPAVPIRKAHK